jgi:ADP-ribosylglycohydrolase
MARELLAWAEKEPAYQRLVGPGTARALQRLREGEDPRLSGREGSTNGAAMRAPVVGMAHPGHPQACLPDVFSMCLPTHGTGPAVSGAAAVASAVAEALREGASLQSILAAARQGAQAGFEAGNRDGAWKWSTPLAGRIEMAEQLVHQSSGTQQALRALYDCVGVDMLVSESVASAFGIILLAGGDPYQAVCCGANIGGDTDTIAAIAGAVCGAWRGIDAIPADLLSRVEELNQLELASLAARLAGLRP